MEFPIFPCCAQTSSLSRLSPVKQKLEQGKVKFGKSVNVAIKGDRPEFFKYQRILNIFTFNIFKFIFIGFIGNFNEFAFSLNYLKCFKDQNCLLQFS